MADFKPVHVNMSDTSQLKTEVAKQTRPLQDQTNLKVTPQLEQSINKSPYGADGMQLSKGENYNPFTTILPNAQAERARNQLKEEDRKKKKKKEPEKKAKKQNFFSWLFGK